jgi:ribose 1,5-bisphosphokinase PhnN
MTNVCQRCGSYRPDKKIDLSGPWAICPNCGERHSFLALPLLLVGGPSGAGKTAILRSLVCQRTDAVLLEGDILWREEFDSPETGYRAFYETWLRMMKNIAQGRVQPVLFSAGAVVPANVEPCVERRYFSRAAYLAIIASADVLRERLQSRPAWRNSGGDQFVEAQVQFSAWIRGQVGSSQQDLTLIDTSAMTVDEAVESARLWIASRTD